MKLPKLIKKSLLAFAVAFPVMAMAEGGDAVVVIAKDGSTFEVQISQVDRIGFGSTQLTVSTTGGETDAIDYKDVDRVLIGAKRQGIADLTAGGNIAVWPTVVESAVNIAGAPAGTPVRVFTSGGALVGSAVCGETGTSLDISAAPSGVCIVAVGDKSVKIIKK